MHESIAKQGRNTGGSATRPALRASSGAKRDMTNVHRSLGNQGLVGVLQPKLHIGQAGDRFEREADRVADQVTSMQLPRAADRPDPVSSVSNAAAAPEVQKKCAECESEVEVAGAEDRPVLAANLCPKCRIGETAGELAPLQRKARNQQPVNVRNTIGSVPDGTVAPTAATRSPAITPGTASALQGLNGRGRSMSPGESQYFEPRFGADFSRVRLHTGTNASQLAQSIDARAFTLGQNIVFGAGEYRPDTQSGKHLMSHELTHTIQQRHTNFASIGRIMRQPTEDSCSDIDRKITQVVVQQETPQTATIYWDDGSVESDICSTGKGTCCVPANDTTGVGATVTESRANNSNWTPITDSKPHTVYKLEEDHRGIKYWTEFNKRFIALHSYRPVDGTPLSHGCVRLRMPFARKIYCGSEEDKTKVHVRGFARPKCDWPNLRREWHRDMTKAIAHLDGEETDPDRRRNNRTSYNLMKRSFAQRGAALESTLRGIDVTDAAASAAAIPRCNSDGAVPTREEGRLYDVNIPSNQLARVQPDDLAVSTPVPVSILAESGFYQHVLRFSARLSAASNMARARRAVRRAANNIWRVARSRAQDTTSPNTDDRPLYWARLEMMRALRQWQPSFRLNDANRENLLTTFERRSRGMDDINFSEAGDDLKILITGFDPFFLDPNSPIGDISRSNPSGAAVLALDGTAVTNGSLRGRIEGAVFPVRFRDFDQGLVEDVVRPHIQGANPADMVMTVSQGSSQFELEQFAGRRRFIQNQGVRGPRDRFVVDNIGRIGGRDLPVVPPDLRADTDVAAAEFRDSSLPLNVIRSTLQQAGATNVVVDPHVEEIARDPNSQFRFNISQTGPSSGSFAAKGSGGGFLSNEISYRTLRLRDTAATESAREIPVGHLHVPRLGSDPEFERVAIKNTVKQIIEASLPELV